MSSFKCLLSLTVQKVSKVQYLEEFSLPHKALQGAGPALRQDLHPLEVHLGDIGKALKTRHYYTQCITLHMNDVW